jgi:hypothetical protein
MPQHTVALSPSAIAPKVHWIRHEKVILDFDLAALYGACRVRLKTFYAVSRLVSQSVTPVPGGLSNSSKIVMSSPFDKRIFFDTLLCG